MSTSVEICNLALIKVGSTRISSLTGEGKTSELCNALLQPTIDFILSRHDWRCARFRQALTQDATAPECEYDYRYQLPTNPYCLVVRAVQIGTEGLEFKDWVQEGRYIITNQDNEDEDLYLIYTGRVVDHTQLPPYLVQAVADMMAWKLSYSLTPKAELREVLKQDAVGPDGNGGSWLAAMQMEQSSGVQDDEGDTSWASEGR